MMELAMLSLGGFCTLLVIFALDRVLNIKLYNTPCNQQLSQRMHKPD